MAQALGTAIAHGASAPVEQKQQPHTAAAQPAGSNAASASASAKVRAIKRKAPAGADMAGPCAEKPPTSGVQAGRAFAPSS